MSPLSHFFSVQKPKNSTEKKSVRKCHEETLGQVFSPAGKIPRLFSDIRQSYLISFYWMRACMRQMRYRIYCMQLHAIACDKCDKCNIGLMRQIRYLLISGLFPSIPFCANKHYLLNLLMTNWNNNPIRCQRRKWTTMAMKPPSFAAVYRQSRSRRCLCL